MSSVCTIHLNDGLLFDDGSPITAKDYVFSLLLQASQAMRALGGAPADLSHLAGFAEYAQEQTEVFSGVRLLDDLSFSLLLKKDKVPFFYEKSFLLVDPYPMAVLAPDVQVVDTEDGAKLEPALTAELLQQTILDPLSGYLVHPVPGSGPYKLTGYNAEAGEAVFEVNPHFLGNHEGRKPAIPSIKFIYASGDDALKGLQNGSIDIIHKLVDGKLSNQGMKLDKVDTAPYARRGFAFFAFDAQSGIASSKAVRQAFAYLVDTAKIAQEYTQGFGWPVYGDYGFGHWAIAEAAGLKAITDLPTEDGKSFAAFDELPFNHYDVHLSRAAALLAGDGWTYNADGEAYKAGQIRHRKTEQGLEPLTLPVLMEQTIAAIMSGNTAMRGAGLNAAPQNSAAPTAVSLSGLMPEGATATASAATADGVNGTVLAAYDIKIHYTALDSLEMRAFQPVKDAPLTVTFASAALEGLEKVDVYHEGVLLHSGVSVRGGSVSFTATEFSVYAIVDTGDEARLKVMLHHANDANTTDIYVKKTDIDVLDTIIHDPGAGSLNDNQLFRGWTTVENYTTDTPVMTIEGVRDVVKTRLGEPLTDGEELHIYPVIFKTFTINYLDENNTSLGAETLLLVNATESSAYTVNMAYTPPSSEQNFEGWNVSAGGDNIVGHVTGTIYQNGTELTIKGDVTFSVNAPLGHWLVFDENGRGATYNAPQFVKQGDATLPPSLPMVRLGYTFGGWYTTKNWEDGEVFNFGQPLTDHVTIYAKWIVDATASYTVIIWKQNVAGDDYDFGEAIHLTGAVGDTIDTVEQAGTGNDAYARVNDVDKIYTGFHLKEFDQNVEITPEGTALVNIWYDRTEYSLSFRDYEYTEATGTSGTQYGIVGSTYVRIYYWSGTWRTGGGTRYTGTRYFRSDVMVEIKSIVALYQQDISDHFPITGTNGIVYNNGQRWKPQSSTPYNQVLVFIDIMPAANVTFHVDIADRPLKTMVYFVEALPGTTEDTHSYNGKVFVKDKTIHARYNFVTEEEDYIEIKGFSKFGSNPPFVNGKALDSVP